MIFDSLICDEYNDTAMNKKNYKDRFLSILSNNGFDFNDIDDSTRLPKSLLPVISNNDGPEPFNKFNLCLSNMHKNNEVNILDAVSFLVNDYLDAPIALKCLDEMNFIALKNELQKKYKIKQNNDDDDEHEELSILDFLE